MRSERVICDGCGEIADPRPTRDWTVVTAERWPTTTPPAVMKFDLCPGCWSLGQAVLMPPSGMRPVEVRLEDREGSEAREPLYVRNPDLDDLPPSEPEPAWEPGRYRLSGDEAVEATRWDGRNLTAVSEWLEAREAGVLVPGRTDAYILDHVTWRPLAVPLGEWIVVDQRGVVRILDDATFHTACKEER